MQDRMEWHYRPMTELLYAIAVKEVSAALQIEQAREAKAA
jgi:hypothetical protein